MLDLKRKYKRMIATLLIMTIIFSLIPYSKADAVAFTITPNCIRGTALPESITVVAPANTFSVGNVYPTLLDSAGNTQALVLENTTDSTVRTRLPQGLSNGTYTLRIGDPKGDKTSANGSKYYEAGTVIIAEPTISSTMPAASVAKAYNENVTFRITGQYTHFKEGQTQAELLSANNTVVDSLTISSIQQGVDAFHQNIDLVLKTGITSGSYKVRLTTDDELVIAEGAVVVRAEPSISVSGAASLSEGYSLSTLTINGTNTGFSQATVVSVLDSQNNNTQKVGNVAVTGTGALTFSLNTGLSTGTYTIKVKTGTEEATASFIINSPSVDIKDSVQAVSVSQLGYANTTKELKLFGTNTHFNSGTTKVVVLNASGNDVTAQALSGNPLISADSQTISITINRTLPIGGYTIRATTSGEVVEDTISIVAPQVQTIVYNTMVYDSSSKKLGQGYTNFIVNISTSNASFSPNTSVKAKTQDGVELVGKASSISVADENTLSFTLNSGLVAGSYVIEIDMDGNPATANDVINHNSHQQLAFTVTQPSIVGITPSSVVNDSGDKVNIAVSGQNTHFKEGATAIRIENQNNLIVGTISNLQIGSQELLTFDLIKNSINTEGKYSIVVITENNGFTESVKLDSGLTINSYGILSVSPGYIYQDALDNNSTMTVVVKGVVLNNTTVQVDGTQVTSTIIDATSLRFKLPVTLAEGIHTLKLLQSAINPMESSFSVRKAREITLNTTSKRLDYSPFSLLVDSDGSINFNAENGKPTITVKGATANITIGAEKISVPENDILTFPFLDNLPYGDYIVGLKWVAGEHADIVLSKDFKVLHRYSEIYFAIGGQKITSITKGEKDSSFNLEVWGKPIESGESDVNITNKTVIVSQNTSVVSIANASVSMKGDGSTSIGTQYDGCSVSIPVVVNKESDINLGGGTPGGQSGEGLPGGGQPGGGLPIGGTGADTGEKNDDVSENNNNNNGEDSSTEGKSKVEVILGDVTPKIVEGGRSIYEVDESIIKLPEETVDIVTLQIENTATKSVELLLKKEVLEKIVDKRAGINIVANNIKMSVPVEILEGVKGSAFKVNIDVVEEKSKEELDKKIDEQYGKTAKNVSEVVDFTISDGSKVISSFKKKVVISIPVDKERLSGVDERKLGIYYYDEAKKQWIYVGGKYNSSTGLLECETDHFTKFTVMSYSKTFPDISSSWAKDYIEVLVAKHIISGKPDGRFDPKGNVTRAEFTKMVVAALGIKLESYKGTFKDCSKDKWYTSYIEVAYKNGLVAGNGKNGFNPDANITREEMAILIMNAYKYQTGNPPQQVLNIKNTSFTDLSAVSSWAKESVLGAKALKFISGMSDGSYMPKRNTSREEAATVIFKLINIGN